MRYAVRFLCSIRILLFSVCNYVFCFVEHFVLSNHSLREKENLSLYIYNINAETKIIFDFYILLFFGCVILILHNKCTCRNCHGYLSARSWRVPAKVSKGGSRDNRTSYL